MKKFTAILLAVMMFATLAITTSAAETFTADFSADDLSSWLVAGNPTVVDGKLVLGGDSSNWISSGYQAIPNPEVVLEKYTFEFDMYGDLRDCYYGIGFRTPADKFGDLNNGSRAALDSGHETGYGISLDIFSKAPDCGNKFVIAFNNGDQQASPFFTVAWPDGYSAGADARFKLVDNGSNFELYVNNTLICKVTLSGLTDGIYTEASAKAADGSDIGSYTVSVLEKGRINFFQRNNTVWVDNVSITEAAAPTPPAPPATEKFVKTDIENVGGQSNNVESRVEGGHLFLKSTGGDPYIQLLGAADAGVVCEDYPYMVIRLKNGNGNAGSVYFGTTEFAGPVFEGKEVIANFSYENTSSESNTVVNMSNSEFYKGTLNYLRYDFFIDNVADTELEVIGIAFFKTEEQAKAWDGSAYNPDTSDASVMVVAAIAAVALAGVVVCKKVKA